jgi:D-hexose-6-phosphate mutarotase
VVEVHKSGFPDAVVWNPWVAKSQAMADFGDEEYKVRRRQWHSVQRERLDSLCRE